MEYRIGVEDIEPDNWVAYAFELPGCFNAARTQVGAIESAPTAIKRYLISMKQSTNEPIEIKVGEVFVSYPAKEDPDYLVNALFENDLRPIDMSSTLSVLEWNRRDLLNLVQPLSAEVLQCHSDPRFGNISGILKHIATSEWWYCDRIGLVADWDSLPDDPFEALEVSRTNTLARLREVEGSTRTTYLISETWSPRKVTRRTLWHERDHINHITQILDRFKSGGC